MKACVPPTLGDQVAGVTAMETKVGVVTTTCVEPVMLPTVAEMLALPADNAFTTTPVALEVTLATVALSLVQLACKVTSAVLPSA